MCDRTWHGMFYVEEQGQVGKLLSKGVRGKWLVYKGMKTFQLVLMILTMLLIVAFLYV